MDKCINSRISLFDIQDVTMKIDDLLWYCKLYGVDIEQCDMVDIVKSDAQRIIINIDGEECCFKITGIDKDRYII